MGVAGDCDDANPVIHPGAEPAADGNSQNCGDTDGDGQPDTVDRDIDNDRFEGANGDGADCDDLDRTIHPAAPDVPDDGIDQDCSGADSTITSYLVSRHNNGTSGNQTSETASASSDGRYVAYTSAATNLVANDTNLRNDVFRTDTQTGTTIRVSTASDGTESAHNSYDAAISGDGNTVAFATVADNLVVGDTNQNWDIFVKDLATGQTTLVTNGYDGSPGDGGSNEPVLSSDGRYVTYMSNASNLVPGDTNNRTDVFVTDLQTGTTTRASVAPDGTQGNRYSSSPSISADGRFVAFYSDATNLVAGDTNNRTDVFVTDTQTGTLTRVSVASDGTQGNGYSFSPAISADGRYVAFESDATTLVVSDTNNAQDVFLTDLQTGTTILVSAKADGTQGFNSSTDATISGDGRYVAYESRASNLVPEASLGRQNIFLFDRLTSQTSLVGVAPDGSVAQANTHDPALSADASAVFFSTEARNLTFPVETTHEEDVFKFITGN